MLEIYIIIINMYYLFKKNILTLKNIKILRM